MSSIKVYGADWCQDTKQTRHHLESQGIQYDYHDVDREPAARAWVSEQNGGQQKLPTVDITGRVLAVPANADVDRALREMGLS